MRSLFRPTGTRLLGALFAFLLSCVALPLTLRFVYAPIRPLFVGTASFFMSLFGLYLVFGFIYVLRDFVLARGGLKATLRLYPKDRETSRAINISLSAFYSICFGLFEYSLAFSESSFFFLSVSVIHVLLAAAKFYLLIRVKFLEQKGENVYLLLSIFFFFISLAIGGICAVLHLVDGAFKHSAFVCIGMAIASAILFIGSIVGTLRLRKQKDETSFLFFKVRHVQLIYSTFALVVSFVNTFSQDPSSKLWLVLSLGFVGSLSILGFSIRMAYLFFKRAQYSKKKLSSESQSKS